MKLEPGSKKHIALANLKANYCTDIRQYFSDEMDLTPDELNAMLLRAVKECSLGLAEYAVILLDRSLTTDELEEILKQALLKNDVATVVCTSNRLGLTHQSEILEEQFRRSIEERFVWNNFVDALESLGRKATISEWEKVLARLIEEGDESFSIYVAKEYLQRDLTEAEKLVLETKKEARDREFAFFGID